MVEGLELWWINASNLDEVAYGVQHGNDRLVVEYLYRVILASGILNSLT